MPHPKIHERIDKKIFGRAFPHVHKWIDSNYNGKNSHTHWVKYHNMQAINEKFPKTTQCRERASARLHVLTDWLFYFKIVFVPLTSSDVFMKLMEHGIVVV